MFWKTASTSSGTGDPNLVPQTGISLFDEMAYSNPALNKSYGPMTVEGTQNAGGAISTAANTATASGRYGIVGIETGTTLNATGQGFLYSDTAVTWAGQVSSLTYQAAVMLPILADGTNDYVAEIGFRNQFTGAFSNNAMAFAYKRSVSTNWMAYTANNGSSTSVTTADASFAVTAGTWYNLKMVVVSGLVSFYIAPGGSTTYALLGTSSTNLPSISFPTLMNHTIYRVASFALRRQLLMDWQKIDITFAGR